MPVVRRDPYAVLEAALRSHLVGSLGGDPYRDIDALVTYQDATGCLYHGTWNGHLRLTAGIAIDSVRVADVLLIATKGSLLATDAIFGKTGSDVGNSTLVARLLHAALFALPPPMSSPFVTIHSMLACDACTRTWGSTAAPTYP